MQLQLKREEVEEGFFKKTIRYNVKVKLEVSDEEREAIKQLGYMDASLVEPYRWNKIEWNLPVKWVIKGDGHGAPAENAAIANQLEAEIKGKAKDLAEQVRAQMEGGGESEEVIDL